MHQITAVIINKVNLFFESVNVSKTERNVFIATIVLSCSCLITNIMLPLLFKKTLEK